MVGPAHRRELLRVRDHGVRRAPHDRAQHEHDQQVLGVGTVPLGTGDPAHPDPEIVVAGEEQHRDEEGLDDPQPAHKAAHHRNAHRLVVLVDLAAQPIAGEGEHDQRRHGDEVADVSHPVVVGALFLGPGREETVACVCAYDRAAEHDVADQAVNVDRHPGVIQDRVPELDAGGRRLGCDVARRRHHVREPRIGNEHHDRAPDVEQDAQTPVHDLGPAVLPPVPTVVVEIQRERLEKENGAVHPHRWREYRKQVREELGIERRQEKRERRPPEGRRAVGDQQQPREFFGQPVVALILAEDADPLGHHSEDRHAQHERREHQVDLGGDPDGGAAADQWEVPICASGIGGSLEQHVLSHRLSVISFGHKERLAF